MPAPVTAIEPLRDIFEIFSRQEGFQRIRWGRWESTDKVQLLIDSLESHRIFETSGADFEAVGSILRPVLAGPSSIPHPPSAVLGASVSLSATFETDITKFLSPLEKAEGCLAVTHRLINEDLAKQDGEEKVKAYLAAIGWSSVGAHAKAMVTREVADSGHLATSGASHVEMRHVNLRRYRWCPVRWDSVPALL
ncbi:hypothetical protein V1515DRAFT_617504 [Lipomyces mesembrius]